MCGFVLAFLCGVVTLTFFSSLPPLYLVGILIVLALLAVFFIPKKFSYEIKLIVAFVLGFSWCLWQANQTLSHQLPSELEGQTIVATGTIAAIPETHSHAMEFEFLINKIVTSVPVKYPLKVRLNWYLTQNYIPLLKTGDTWQLMIRLKKPRGFWNVGSFDYQAWLFEHGIRATGYVIDNSNNHLISQNCLNNFVDRMREKISMGVTQALKDYPTVGLINALAVGVRYEITEQQWQVMRGTGTNHLFAIAGLHIGFVSGMIFALVSFLWRRMGRVALYIPTPQAAALAALVSAIFYSALAGFALPTQRAVIMIAVFLLATLLRKNLPTWQAWGLALLMILIIEPLAVLSDSFWLSFGAVAYIIYGVSSRINPKGLWWHWGRVQWVIAIGLIPLTLLFFHQTSLLGFIANAIAIPWTGFVVLPLSLLGSLIYLIFPPFGKILLILAAKALECIWWILTKISTIEWMQWYTYVPNVWVLLSASIGMLLLLAPKGFPARWLGCIWLLPLIIWKPAGPKAGELWFSLLDVGQGLATVVRTQHHVLVYDTGPRFSDTFDTGNAVVIPFLQSVGIKKIDIMMISHPDNDHIGGAYSILDQMPVQQVITSVPTKFKLGRATLCYAGQQWEWDKVKFQVIYPPLGRDDLDNDSSCVLRIDDGRQSILLVGDIEKMSERYLVENTKNLLPATMLVAPHHGSKTSSTSEFIAAVHPQYVLFPVGYRNKFHFPHMEVVTRYQQSGAKLYSTVDEGMMTFKLTGQGGVELAETFRQKYFRFWY